MIPVKPMDEGFPCKSIGYDRNTIFKKYSLYALKPSAVGFARIRSTTRAGIIGKK
jgi:hypothetical protein